MVFLLLFFFRLSCAGLGCAGLVCAWKGWAGLGWEGLCCAGLGCTGKGWVSFKKDNTMGKQEDVCLCFINLFHLNGQYINTATAQYPRRNSSILMQKLHNKSVETFKNQCTNRLIYKEKQLNI